MTSDKFHAITSAAIRLIKPFVSIIILIISTHLCRDIILNSISNQNNKNDYAELNHIKYGLFSIDEWKRQIAVILAEEVNKLDLLETNQQALRKHIETVLISLIDEIDRKVREGNLESTTGRIKQSIIDAFVSMKDIKKGVPAYADIVIKEMKKRKTREQFRAVLSKKLEQYIDTTFETKNTVQIQDILQRNDRMDIASARISLNKLIAGNHDLIFKEAMLLILLSVIHFTLSAFNKRPLAPSSFMLLVFSLVLLLTAGVTTPMIDVEAKISHLGFVLIGHSINFNNQVLYFQSKSILDVFRIMIVHKDILMKFVGVLLITFSVFFPLLKIASSFAYYYNYRNAEENPFVKFFVLKSGKWSMADVMVIAIFMAYIGFNGIITSQLGQLNEAGMYPDILTTNGTALQPGYYLFVAYVLLGLFLTGFITRKPRGVERENP